MARHLPSMPARARHREARVVTGALAFGLASLLGLATCEPRPAKAEPEAMVPCGAYEDFAWDLRAAGERPVFQGLDVRGLVVEVWTGPSGSWSLIDVDTARLTCLSAVGEAGVLLPALVEERRR